ncbi:MAG TPA: DUF222 domain-containing protein [Acidimicrobiales bacterium]|jgi:hypothetical protein|nr:DUF222 domain-containing protein [Acidimicrobiales bacterium]
MDTDSGIGRLELTASEVAGMSNEQLAGHLDGLFRLRSAVDGRILVLLGEAERRQTFREDGATSAENWAVERFSVAVPTARALVHVAEKAWDLPQLTEALKGGEITFDKFRAVADVATPETDAELVEAARRRSVRELAEVARSQREAPAPSQSALDHDRRSLRFNDTFRTMTVQLPPESFAETRTCIESIARDIPSDGETPWDQRLCDGFMGLVRSRAGGAGGDVASRNPYYVVVHVPIAALVDESGESSDLAGELERDGLIGTATVQKLSCDATIALAIDDDAGRTMYEGRSRRDPTGPQRREVRRRDRHCRFPGCANVTFTNTHHIRRWKPDRGPTDLDNLCLLCVHHHHLVHQGGWTMSGDANDELTFVGPSGRVMTSRPSPLWTAVTGPAAQRAVASRKAKSDSTSGTTDASSADEQPRNTPPHPPRPH